VPSRNRPFRPRQSTCVITGLPARYRDPRTGIPYATTEAFAMLRRILAGEFLWTGSPQSGVALSAGCYAAAHGDDGAGGVFLDM
jgi:vacuolar protein sorting-associated protein 72